MGDTRLSTPSYSVDDTIDRLHRFNRWYAPSAGDEADSTPQPVRGINVSGYLRDESGWGAAARGYVAALRQLGVPMSLIDVSTLSSNRSRHPALVEPEKPEALGKYDVNLVCVDAGQHFAALGTIGEELFEHRYNIGAWAWELPRFPHGWYDRFAYYDEIWVGTSFIASALAPISPVPVVRVPPVLTPQRPGSRSQGRQRLGVDANTFVFLFVFDFHSHMARKNPMAAIDAFQAAFRPGEPVRLVIKSVNADSDPAGFETLRASAAGDGRVSLYDGYWPTGAISDLMAACDGYLSLHRSEGTGLTISDAMALGKPVIATGWSGNMDFMTIANSYPVNFELVKIEENVGPYRAGETWAEPSVEHASQLLRHVVDDPAAARRKGASAERDLQASYSESAVAEIVGQRLDMIATRYRFRALKREMRSFLAGYRSLVDGIRTVVAATTPRDATVAVVSKGDDELVELEGRRGWHFPRGADGGYAGFYPADSAAAIQHLDSLRAAGADHLLFPGTGLWWLEHYEGFRRYLDDTYARVWDDERCVLFRLVGHG